MSLASIRERIRSHLSLRSEWLQSVFMVLNFLVTIMVLATMVWIGGFHQNAMEQQFARWLVRVSFGFYGMFYLVRAYKYTNPQDFIKRNKWEGIVLLMLLSVGIGSAVVSGSVAELTHDKSPIDYLFDISTLIIQCWILIPLQVKYFRQRSFLRSFEIHPPLVFVLLFLSIIGCGTLALMFPQMTVRGHLPFVDALFTSASAATLTGLMTVDAHIVFTFKGQIVILLLIQTGACIVLGFASYIFFTNKYGSKLKDVRIWKKIADNHGFLSGRRMMGKIFIWMMVIELAGAVAMYQLWSPDMAWSNAGERLFYSIFHSISAFNHAGISLFTGGLANGSVAENYLLHWVMIFLFFFGSLGMLVIFDLFDPAKLRDRLKHPWRRISFTSKVALYFSLVLVGMGALLFYLFECQGLLAEKSVFAKVTASFFQAIAPRTAGFYTTDTSLWSMSTVMLIMALMLVGGSSSSTSGGIKTSTYAVIWADVFALILGRRSAKLFGSAITSSHKRIAYSIVVIYLGMNMIGGILLCFSETRILNMSGRSAIDLIFEQISALSSVGLSRGLTPILSVTGKYIITASMVMGRVGLMVLIYSIACRFAKDNRNNSELRITVG